MTSEEFGTARTASGFIAGMALPMDGGITAV